MQFLSRPPCSTDPNSRTNLCPVKSAVAANVSSRVISPLLRRPHVATNVSSWPILPFSSPPPLHHSNSSSPHHSHTPFPTTVPSPALPRKLSGLAPCLSPSVVNLSPSRPFSHYFATGSVSY